MGAMDWRNPWESSPDSKIRNVDRRTEVLEKRAIPDDEAIYLGVLISCFLVFFDVFLIYRIVSSKIRQGQRMEAVKWAVGCLLLGLLVAAVAGSLPWLLSRLNAALPWVRGTPWALLFASYLIANSLWLRWRARKAS